MVKPLKTRGLDSGPIPGESLLRKKGEAAWEKPPVISDPQEAFEFYVDMFSDDKVKDGIFSFLEAEVPISVLVVVLTRAQTRKGMHTVDLGIALRPIVHEYIKALADEADIPYIEDASEVGLEEREKESEKGSLGALALTGQDNPEDATNELVEEEMNAGGGDGEEGLFQPPNNEEEEELPQKGLME